jgi:crotonobetainyl-CoA:carnitine CoA-transferase CaiB-like acyl-CoA transferase
VPEFVFRRPRPSRPTAPGALAARAALRALQALTTASPLVFDGERATYVQAPRLGEHTREVLASIGYDAARIDALVATGVVAADER